MLTTEWVDGLSWAEFRDDRRRRRRASAPARSIWRFAQHAVHRIGAFNGDPHPGNYRFSSDGDVTFLDFGLVKRWTPGEWEQLAPSLDAIVVHRDPERLVRAMEDDRLPPRRPRAWRRRTVFDYVSTPYTPYLTDTFTFTRDVRARHAERRSSTSRVRTPR